MKEKVTLTESELKEYIKSAVSLLLSEGLFDTVKDKMRQASLKTHEFMNETPKTNYLLLIKKLVKDNYPGYSIILRSREDMIRDENCILNDYWAKIIDTSSFEHFPSFKVPCLYKSGEKIYTPLRSVSISAGKEQEYGFVKNMNNLTKKYLIKAIEEAINVLSHSKDFDKTKLRNIWKKDDLHEE